MSKFKFKLQNRDTIGDNSFVQVQHNMQHRATISAICLAELLFYWSPCWVFFMSNVHTWNPHDVLNQLGISCNR